MPRPELAIAAFGVLDAMMRVMLGPLRNLTQAVQTLTKNEADTIVIGKFTIHLGIIFGVIMLLFHIDICSKLCIERYYGPFIVTGLLCYTRFIIDPNFSIEYDICRFYSWAVIGKS